MRPTVYDEYVVGVIVSFFILMTLEVLGKILFKTPVRTYSRFIGSVVLSFVMVLHDRFEMSFGAYFGLLVVAVSLWCLLEWIFIPNMKK